MTESNIYHIIKSIQDNGEKVRAEKDNNWIKTKTYWCKYTDANSLSNEIISNIKDILKIEENELEQNSKSNISVVKNNDGRIWFWREEEALERLICLFNENMINQYQLSKDIRRKELADIVELHDNKVKTLIELKSWNNTQDSPLFAIIEILKNYYLSADRYNINELVILAPEEYYKYYDAPNDKLKELIDSLNNVLFNENCHITMKQINIKFENWENTVYNTMKNLDFKPVENCKYYCGVNLIYLSDYKNYFEIYKDKLLKNEWSDIWGN